MAKLEIVKKEGARGLTLSDYDILVDGQEPSMITGIELRMDAQEFNFATITFGVEELKVDGEFLSLLKAKIDDSTKVEAKE